jgi:hypothetical protein
MISFSQILATRPDPLDVLKTTAFVVQHARYVKINHTAIERAADALAEKRVEPPAWNYEYHYHDGTEHTVNYLFLLDALNFCFWGKPRWTIECNGKQLDGYWALAASLKRAVEEDPHLLNTRLLTRLTPQELAKILRGRGKLPLLEERWNNLRELAAGLHILWNGSAARLVESANGDAAQLAQTIANDFASFNDVAVYRKRKVRFLKRAQILVADLWGAFGGKQWGAFKNIDHLTAFADYKLPQILRAWGILEYSSSLARKVDARVELAAGSASEIEIRAATLWAVEFLRDALAARGRELWSIQVDWILWEASQGRFENMRPYHRVRTVYY